MEDEPLSSKIRRVPKLQKYHPTNEEFDYYKKIQEEYEKAKKRDLDVTKNNDNEKRS